MFKRKKKSATFRLTEEILDDIMELAEEQQCSRADVISKAVCLFKMNMTQTDYKEWLGRLFW